MRSRNSTLLTAALNIASKGKPVFPCKNKKPLTERGFKDASVDPRRVNAYWNRHRGAKIGMPTGRRSGVFVVDEDRLGALEELPHKLPETLTVRTPRGGRHYYLNHVEGLTNSTGALPDGIDIRGEGGYVIVPPSPGYEVEHRAPIANAPDWLLEALRDEPHKHSGTGRSRSETPADSEPIPEGSRNQTLLFYALDLKDQGRDRDEVLDRTLEANATRCQPPLPEREVESVVKSAMRYPVRSGNPSPEVEEYVSRLEADWWETAWKGVGGKTDRDCMKVLIELTRRYGRLTEDGQGVEVSASVRVVALAAATSYVTVSRGVTKRLASAGKVVKLDAGRGSREAATWRLFASAQGANTQHSCATSPEGMLCVNSVRGSERKHLWDLKTPAFRWSGLVGKGRAGVLYILEAYGPMTKEEIAERLGAARARDVVRRYLEGYHDEKRDKDIYGLLDLGLVEERDGVYSVPDDYEKRIDIVRNMRYATHRKVKKRSRDEGRTVTEVEYTPYASEVEREMKDIRDYEKHCRAYAQHLERLREVESTSFDELPSVPVQRDQPDCRRSWGGLTEDEEWDADAILEFEKQYGLFGWNAAAAKKLFYRTGRWPDAETLHKLKGYLGVAGGVA